MTSWTGRSAPSSAVLQTQENLDLLADAENVPPTNYCPRRRSSSDQEVSRACGHAVNTETLHTWLNDEIITEEFREADTIVIIVDTQPLSDYEYFATTGKLWYQRSRWTLRERLHVVFVQCSHDNDLLSCHMTHAGVHVLRSLRARFPGKHMILSDADCAPCALSEVWQYVQLARDIQDACATGDLPLSHSPGLILHNEKGGRANAGLIISPGIGEKGADVAPSVQEWCELLTARETFLLQQKCSTVPEDIYDAHVRAFTDGTPLAGVRVECPADYLHLLAIVCNILNMSAWGHQRHSRERACLGKFSEAIRNAIPFLGGWAGPFCEQVALSLLEAFQTPQCYITYLPSELGFMKQRVSAHMSSSGDYSEPAVMPPLYVHGFGPAKADLSRLKLNYWVTFEESLQGAFRWRPCFMDAVEGETAVVQVSAGMCASVQVQEHDRCVHDASGWRCWSSSTSLAFAGQLSDVIVNSDTWPLGFFLPVNSVVASPSTVVASPSAADALNLDEDWMSREVRVECPGMTVHQAEAANGMFHRVCQLAFRNVGSLACAGPTREQAEHKEQCRVADNNLDALHYILRDSGARPAWKELFPNLPDTSMSDSSPISSTPFCPSWLAKPCSAVVFALFALFCQFTRHAETFLSVFHTSHQPRPEQSTLSVEIRGFSFGSYTAVLLFRLLQKFRDRLGIANLKAVAGGIALPPKQVPLDCSGLRLLHVLEDQCCRWNPRPETLSCLRGRGCVVTLLTCKQTWYAKQTLGNSLHGYSSFVRHEGLVPFSEDVPLDIKEVLATIPVPSWYHGGSWALTFIAWGLTVGFVSDQWMSAWYGFLCSETDNADDASVSLSVRRSPVYPGPSSNRRASDFTSVAFDQNSLDHALEELGKATSPVHARFVKHVVLPWMAANHCYRQSQTQPLVSVYASHNDAVNVHVEILARLGPRAAVLQMWFDSPKWSRWAQWSSDVSSGFFIGQMLEGDLVRSVVPDGATARYRFSSVVRRQHVAQDKNPYTTAVERFAAVQVLELLAQFSDQSVNEDVVLDLYRAGPNLQLEKFSKVTTRICAAPMMRLLSLHPASLRIVFGQKGLPRELSTRPAVHPRACQLCEIAICWERASRQLMKSHVRVVNGIAEGRFDDLFALIESPRLDGVLARAWQPLAHLGRSFAEMFWKALAEEKSALPRVLGHVALTMMRQTKTAYVQGFPGSGKTTMMSLLAVSLCEQLDFCILWTAVNVNAIKQGACCVDGLLKDAAPFVRQKFARFLGLNHDVACDLDVTCVDRRSMVGSFLKQKVILMTDEGFMQEHTSAYTKLKPVADLVFKDESQQGGTPAHAFQFDFLQSCGCAVQFGDQLQTKIAVDSRNKQMARVVAEIEARDPGIRCEALRWTSSHLWAEESLKFLGVGGVADDDGPLVTLMSYALESAFQPPATVDVQAVRESCCPQITLAASRRLPEFLYAVTVACAYDHLVHISPGVSGNAANVDLGRLPATGHDPLQHVDKRHPQIVWLQPYGHVLYAKPAGHCCNVLAILAHLCFHRGRKYTTGQPLGVVFSSRAVFESTYAHFSQAAHTAGFSGATLSSQSYVFVPNKDSDLISNVQEALRTDELELSDICHVLVQTPWVVKDFISLSVSMSAVGAEKLDVLLYRSRPNVFVDKDDQSIVSSTRNQGHLYVYCDLSRVRGFLARVAAFSLRLCPLIYFAAAEHDDVCTRARQLNISVPGEVLGLRHVKELLSHKVGWRSKPMAIAVRVIFAGGEITRVLLIRAFVSRFHRACLPDFVVDLWTSWYWQADSVSCLHLHQQSLEDARWTLIPHRNNWVLKIGRKIIASRHSRHALANSSFNMEIVPGSGPGLSAVQVGILPSHTFATYRKLTTALMDCHLPALRQTSEQHRAEPDSPSVTEAAESESSSMPSRLADVAGICGEDTRSSEVSQDPNEQTDSDASSVASDRLQVEGPSEQAAAFSQHTIDLDERARSLYQWFRLSCNLVNDTINGCLSPHNAFALYNGLNVEGPWSLAIFNVRSLVEALARAKLAKLHVAGHTARPDNYDLFLLLSQFIHAVFSMLPDEPPFWWHDVMNGLAFRVFKSLDFIKVQVAYALQNMEMSSNDMHRPCLFFMTRGDFEVGTQQVAKDLGPKVVKILEYVRMRLPAGFALYIRHRMCQENQQMQDCFVAAPCDGRQLVLSLKESFMASAFSLYRQRTVLTDLILSGVNVDVLRKLGGTATAVNINFLALAEATDHDFGGCKHGFLYSRLSDCETKGHSQAFEAAASILGPDERSILEYSKMVASAQGMFDEYKAEQHAKFDFHRYVEDGMPVHIISDYVYVQQVKQPRKRHRKTFW